MGLSLGILDQSPVLAGARPRDAVVETLALAREAERLGYERYWLGEHHAMRGLADPAPEILLARMTAETTRMRIGTGGVLLPHYAPLKVAEQFRLLEALAPGRIDLGIGRAPGGSQRVSAALESREVARFPRQVQEVIGFPDGTLAGTHPPATLVALPRWCAPRAPVARGNRLPRQRPRGHASAREAHRDADRRDVARGVAAGLLRLQRRARRRAGPALRVRALHQRRCVGGHAHVPAPLPRVGEAAGTARDPVRRRARGGDARGGRRAGGDDRLVALAHPARNRPAGAVARRSARVPVHRVRPRRDRLQPAPARAPGAAGG